MTISKDKIKLILKKILIMASWGLIGWIFGSIVGWFIFAEIGEQIGRILFLIIGLIIGWKSHSFWVFI